MLIITRYDGRIEPAHGAGAVTSTDDLKDSLDSLSLSFYFLTPSFLVHQSLSHPFHILYESYIFFSSSHLYTLCSFAHSLSFSLSLLLPTFFLWPFFARFIFFFLNIFMLLRSTRLQLELTRAIYIFIQDEAWRLWNINPTKSPYYHHRKTAKSIENAHIKTMKKSNQNTFPCFGLINMASIVGKKKKKRKRAPASSNHRLSNPQQCSNISLLYKKECDDDDRAGHNHSIGESCPVAYTHYTDTHKTTLDSGD